MAKKTSTTGSNTTKRTRSKPSAPKVSRRTTNKGAVDSQPAEAMAAPAKPATRVVAQARPAQPSSSEALASRGERQPVPPEQRARAIAEAAYYRAERRGFEPGLEEQDWLEAEREVDGRGA